MSLLLGDSGRRLSYVAIPPTGRIALTCHTGTVLERPHLTYFGNRRGRMTKPDPTLLDDVVVPKVLDAMRVASKALSALGIRHVVVGGLAVGANGYPRATKDVDFLVGDEAFEHHAGGFVTLKPGVPIQVNTVAIDLLSATEKEAHLSAALAAPAGSFMEAPQLVYMKLKSPRQKDRVDVIELVKGGIDVDACRAYLTTNAPSYLASFDDAVAVARAEE